MHVEPGTGPEEDDGHDRGRARPLSWANARCWRPPREKAAILERPQRAWRLVRHGRGRQDGLPNTVGSVLVFYAHAKAISQAFKPPAYNITAAASESAHVGQPTQGLHYLSSVEAMTYPSHDLSQSMSTTSTKALMFLKARFSGTRPGALFSASQRGWI